MNECDITLVQKHAWTGCRTSQPMFLTRESCTCSYTELWFSYCPYIFLNLRHILGNRILNFLDIMVLFPVNFGNIFFKGVEILVQEYFGGDAKYRLGDRVGTCLVMLFAGRLNAY